MEAIAISHVVIIKTISLGHLLSVHIFNEVYLLSQLANCDQISCEASSGSGKDCIRVLGCLDCQCLSWQHKSPIDI